MAVITFTSAGLEVNTTHDFSLKHLLPVIVAGSHSFRLLAVWTKEDDEQRAMYIGLAVLGVQRYTSFLAGDATVAVGDFNSNRIWDRPDRPYTHTEMVELLNGHGLVSAYHHYHGEAQGTETLHTFYIYRKQERGFHIDHCFVPKAWTPFLRLFRVGAYKDWRHLSDHCPMVVEFNFETRSGPLRRLRWIRSWS